MYRLTLRTPARALLLATLTVAMSTTALPPRGGDVVVAHRPVARGPFLTSALQRPLATASSTTLAPLFSRAPHAVLVDTSAPTPTQTPLLTLAATPPGSATPVPLLTSTPLVPTVVVTATGTPGYVLAWGANDSGQLGTGMTTTLTAPTVIAGLGNNIIALAAGATHSLALTTDGHVWAWGANESGELGLGTTAGSNVPIALPTLSNVVAIAAGTSDSLALTANGAVWAWGINTLGQAGIGRITPTVILTPTAISGLSNIIAISAGGAHNLALRNDGTVWSWGTDDSGQTGQSAPQTCAGIPCNPNPVRLSGFANVTEIAAGGAHSLALRSDGSVWGWGSNTNGQLGASGLVTSSIPLRVSIPGAVMAIAAGFTHSLALDAAGTVWGWGSQRTVTSYTCGTCSQPNTIASHARAIAAGDGYSLIYTAAQTVMADGVGSVVSPAGNNFFGGVSTLYEQGVQTLGGGPMAQHALMLADPLVTLSSPGPLTFGPVVSGTSSGEQDVTITSIGSIPLTIDSVTISGPGASDYTLSLDLCSGVTLSQNGICAIGVTFAPYGSGTSTATLTITDNTPGSPHMIALSGTSILPTATTTPTSMPTFTLTPTSTPTQTATVVSSSTPITVLPTVVLSATGTPGYVLGWGANDAGQLGTGMTTTLTTPTLITTLGDNVVALAAGATHSLALTTDGHVWAWGANESGQLGLGNTAGSTIPIELPTLSNVVAIAAGTSDSVALTSNGQVWTWGTNALGQAGVGSITPTLILVPTPVTGLSNIIAISAGGAHNLALRSDGTVWAWGSDDSGQTGQTAAPLCGRVSCNTSPVPIFGFTHVKTIAAGAEHSLALRNDGSVWAWGSNASGQLGTNSVSISAIPLKVTGVATATAITAGTMQSMAIDAMGDVIYWGFQNGQYGPPSTFLGLDGPGVTTIGAGNSYSLEGSSVRGIYAFGYGAVVPTLFVGNLGYGGSVYGQGIVSVAVGPVAQHALMIVAPIISFAPSTALHFSPQVTNTSSSEQDVTIQSNGSFPLSVTSVTLSGPNANDYVLSLDLCSGSTLQQNGSCTVGVTFTPHSSGASNATLLITDNAPGSPQAIALNGTGALATPTSTVTPTLTPTATATSTPSAAMTGTPTPTWTLIPTATAPATVTPRPMWTPVPTSPAFVVVIVPPPTPKPTATTAVSLLAPGPDQQVILTATPVFQAPVLPRPTAAPTSHRPSGLARKGHRSPVPLPTQGTLTVRSGGLLTLTIKTVAHAHVTMSLEVTRSQVITTGVGEKRHRIRHTVVLYRSSIQQGLSNSLGVYQAQLRVAYRTMVGMRGRVQIRIQVGKTVVQRTLALIVTALVPHI